MRIPAPPGKGPHPDRPEVTARIEAAAYRGRPVSFALFAPWTTPSDTDLLDDVGDGDQLGLQLGLSRRVRRRCLSRAPGPRLDRADGAGALRLGLAVISRASYPWALGSAHTASEVEMTMLLNAVGAALVNALLLWTFYLALEALHTPPLSAGARRMEPPSFGPLA